MLYFFHSEQIPMWQKAEYQSRACRVISDYATKTATLIKTYNVIKFAYPPIHD